MRLLAPVALAALVLLASLTPPPADAQGILCQGCGGNSGGGGVRWMQHYQAPLQQTYGWSTAPSWDCGAYLSGVTSTPGLNTQVYLQRYRCDGTLLWTSLPYGGVSRDEAWDMTTVHGTLSDEVYLVGIQQVGFTHVDVLVMRYTDAGALVCTATFGGSQDDWGYGVTPAPGGGVFVVGWAHGAPFLARYDALCAQTWILPLPVNRAVWAVSAHAVGAGTEVYLVGDVRYPTHHDVFLQKHSCAATCSAPPTLSWDRVWGGPGNHEVGRGVAVFDESGARGVYVTGHVNSGTALLQRWDDAGNLVWSRQDDLVDGGAGRAVAARPGGGVYMTGEFGRNGPGRLQAFLAGYDASGAPLWTRTWGGADWDYGSDVAVTVDGHPVVAGSAFSWPNANGAWQAFLRGFC